MNPVSEADWQARLAEIQELRSARECLWIQRCRRCEGLLTRVRLALGERIAQS
jgi:hypothetical protein